MLCVINVCLVSCWIVRQKWFGLRLDENAATWFVSIICNTWNLIAFFLFTNTSTPELFLVWETRDGMWILHCAPCAQFVSYKKMFVYVLYQLVVFVCVSVCSVLEILHPKTEAFQGLHSLEAHSLQDLSQSISSTQNVH